MKSTISYFKILASASCILALSACDSVKDVPEKPTGNLPPDTVVLSGEINNLSGLRSITLQNNGDGANAKSFINAAPTVPNVGVRPVPFSFGATPVGTAYNITIKQQPEFKTCVVVNGTGVLTAGVRPDIVVNCTNSAATTGPGARFNLSVNLPSNPALFKGLQDARVRVTTEEEIREVVVTSTTTSPIVFNNVLINGTGTPNAATWAVTASTFEGNTLNKCIVTFATGSNATANVTAPVIGFVPTAVPPAVQIVDSTASACQYQVSGKVGYSQPSGGTIATISGLKLQLRDMQANVVQEIPVADCTPTTGAVGLTAAPLPPAAPTTTLGAVVPIPTNGCDYNFTTPIRSSSSSGLYEVAVSQQPTGQFCIVVNGGSVSVFTQGTTAPVNPTNANVFCRSVPATASRQLQGVYRLQSSTFTPNAILGSPAPLTSTWLPFDLTKWNTASSNMIAFFPNGTFLYGAHANGAQAEHGFYDYDPVAHTLRFTLIVDTNNSLVYPANWSPTPIVPVGSLFTQVTQVFTTTPGISALPNSIRVNGATGAAPNFATAQAAMTGVAVGTADSGLGAVKTISGTFGADPAGIASYVRNTTVACSATAPCINPTTGALITTSTCTVAAPCANSTDGALTVTAGSTCIPSAAPCYMPNYAYRVSWTLQEVPQVNGEVTGGWVSQDSRRLWVWDYRTYFGTGVGMLGGSPSMNDACFTMENLHAALGIYTRRGSATGCFPYSRPANGQFPGYFASPAESVDLTIAGASAAAIIPTLPGYTGRIPGGEPAPQITSPSPIYFQVAPAAQFATVADPNYFPSPATSWCTTEILGMRASANGYPINPPVYFCRTRSNL